MEYHQAWQNGVLSSKMHMNISSLEVLFTPADFSSLRECDLSMTVCVVFDVLRATSSMVTALGNGAAAILPVEDIPQALALREQRAEVLLAGERNGLIIGADLTGSVSFDLGNSPREFRQETVAGKTIVMTTTNGTRALRACAHAKRVLISSFLNLTVTVGSLEGADPVRLMLVCGGTHEQAAYEDVLCAGALCDLVWANCNQDSVSDSALVARMLFRQERQDLLAAISRSCNGRRLLASPQLRDDVRFCVQLDSVNLVAAMDQDGLLRGSFIQLA